MAVRYYILNYTMMKLADTKKDKMLRESKEAKDSCVLMCASFLRRMQQLFICSDAIRERTWEGHSSHIASVIGCYDHCCYYFQQMEIAFRAWPFIGWEGCGCNWGKMCIEKNPGHLLHRAWCLLFYLGGKNKAAILLLLNISSKV